VTLTVSEELLKPLICIEPLPVSVCCKLSVPVTVWLQLKLYAEAVLMVTAWLGRLNPANPSAVTATDANRTTEPDISLFLTSNRNP
jgi:hypothetical protein